MIHNKSPIGLILIGPSREGLVGLGTQSSGLGFFFTFLDFSWTTGPGSGPGQ
uniref:Candidate secreted effector n=1 Tax=Meloidogyne incognita TaxID=6306 RepID=A0A914MGX1_MELIC